MKRIKTFFVMVLIFSSVMCFATKEEDILAEEQELKKAVLEPIVDHFPANSSYTWRISQAIVEYEKNKKIQFSMDDARSYAHHISEEPEFKDSDYTCVWKAMNEIDGSDANGFAAKWILAWQMNIIQCGGYADLALITFNFNMMNYKAYGVKPIFKAATFVTTLKGTGDHVFILVEGISGMVFAVDPWVRLGKNMKPIPGMIERLPGFPKFSNLTSQGGVYHLSHEDNDRLNDLFSARDESGKLYYDGMFINQNTSWSLAIAKSDKISCIAKSGGAIKTLYEDLNLPNPRFPERAPWFPRWGMSYDKLITLSADKESLRCSVM